MIHAYFDDSSDQNMEEFVVCGGILEDEFKIAVLESRWHNATQMLKKPFRSTDCECQKGQFKNWSKIECDALFETLVGLMSRDIAAVGNVATVIPIPIYREVFPNSRREGPYMFAVRMTIVEMARLGARFKQNVKLWFEKGTHQGKISEAYNSLKEHQLWKLEERRALSGISFDDKSLLPLQAADLVAREGFKYARNQRERPLRKPLAKLWSRVGIVFWTRESLQVVKDRGGPDNPDALINLPAAFYLKERRDSEARFFSIRA